MRVLRNTDTGYGSCNGASGGGRAFAAAVARSRNGAKALFSRALHATATGARSGVAAAAAAVARTRPAVPVSGAGAGAGVMDRALSAMATPGLHQARAVLKPATAAAAQADARVVKAQPQAQAQPQTSVSAAKSLVALGDARSRNVPLAFSPELSQRDIRDRLTHAFHQSYDLYEKLFDAVLQAPATAALAHDPLRLRPEMLRHPLIFYAAHTSVLYVNKLKLAGLLDKGVDARIENMCAVGVDENSWDDLNQNNYHWPSTDQAYAYRRAVRQIVHDRIQTLHFPTAKEGEGAGAVKFGSPLWAVWMGIDHERVHLETSSVLFRQLNPQYLAPLPFWAVCPPTPAVLRASDAPRNAMVTVAAPDASLRHGRSFESSPVYGWDIDYGVSAPVRERVPHAFRASQYLVSNGEFFEFVKAGGYSDARFWDDEGWAWVSDKHVAHPTFWVPNAQAEGGFQYRAMLQVLPMRWDWPVDVNALEAAAFCRWKSHTLGLTLPAAPGAAAAASAAAVGGATRLHRVNPHTLQLRFDAVRLPTEDEFVAVREHAGYTAQRDEPYWGAAAAPANLNLEHFASSTPVNRFAFANGLYDAVGNVWQHTSTVLDALPGYRNTHLYADYSSPAVADGRHDVLRGGSWVSTGNFATRDARNYFRRHFFQHSGFRYVQSVQPTQPTQPITRS